MIRKFPFGSLSAVALLSVSTACAQESAQDEEATPAAIIEELDIREWDVPWAETRPRDPFAVSASEVWFVGQGGHYAAMLDPQTGEFERVDLDDGTGPHNLIVGEDGTVWIVLLGTNKLASADPETLELTEYEIPREGARPRRIGLTDDGRVWYVDFREGTLGAYDPASASWKEWDTPTGSDSRPYGMAVDGNNRIWFVETGVQPNRFVGFDPVTESYFAGDDVPSGGGTVRHMHYHEASNTIWFGADTNTIGRVALD